MQLTELIKQLEPHCQTPMQQDYFKKLKKIQKFKIQKDASLLGGLLNSFFVVEKYDLVHSFFEVLVGTPFNENLPAWHPIEQILCSFYESPLATSEQKTAIKKRFLEIANFKASVPEAQILYDNYLDDILSLKEIHQRKEILKKRDENDEFYEQIIRFSLVLQAIRVKIANAVGQKQETLHQEMETLITEQLSELKTPRLMKFV